MPLTEQRPSKGQESLGDWGMLYLKGIAMGAAEVVPGVSGGTIAFITGIYERLLRAIGGFTPVLLLVMRKRGWRAAWQHVDGTFLMVLFSGMLTSIFTVARVISFALANYPVLIWSFFFGLIVASVYLVAHEVRRWTFSPLLALLLGSTCGFAMTQLVPLEAAPGLPYIFVCGAFAVCAWILPGISGSYILLLLGLYTTLLTAISALDVEFLATLALGCVLGLICFAHILSYLFKSFRDQTLALLTGFMIGSLAKVWPWKHTLSYQLGHNDEQIPLVQEAVTPFIYQELTGLEPQLLLALVATAAAILVVIGLEKLTAK